MVFSLKFGRSFGISVCSGLRSSYFSRAKFSISISKNKTSKSGSHQAQPWNTKSEHKVISSELPSLPVPSLSETIINFLIFSKQVQPNHEDFIQTLKVSSEFVQSEEVRKLQELLKARARSMPNWLTPWWVNVAYLEGRSPLPIVTSPGMTLPKLDFYGIDGQIECASRIIHAALSYHHIIKSGQLARESAGGLPLDMSQYHFMFGTTRIPRRGRDEILYGKDRANWSQHIVVTRNGHSFQVNVYDKGGQLLSVPLIKAQLQEVVSESEHFNEIGPVNIVSTDNRDVWADVYERVKISSPTSIQSFEEALFVLSLDRSGKSKGYVTAEENMRQALHGGGTDRNTFNRWFDKAIQFYVNENGHAGFTYEHTPAEGPPFAALLDYVQDQLLLDNLDAQCSQSAGDVEKPHRLKFRLTDEDKAAVRNSAQRINSAIEDLEVKCLSFDGFGKSVPKSAKMSPDSFIQIAMQLAFYNIHETHPPTYETATLRRFAEGRTETIRLPNIESAAFVEKAQSSSDWAELRSCLAEAVNSHKKYSMWAMNGKGMDRHLLGLKLICLEQQKLNEKSALTLPSLYTSKSYKRLMHFQISSSQVPTRNELPMGYGPSAEDCYAVCYNPRENEMNFTITAFNSCERTSADRYARELENALMKMKDIVSK